MHYFHEKSEDKILVPILVATEAKCIDNEITQNRLGIINPLCCTEENLGKYIHLIVDKYKRNLWNVREWIEARYAPTPTIVEAAQVLYREHQVEEISRSDASAINLTKTTEQIFKIIDESKKTGKKSICFITGVPGAGKTLAGLNIATTRQNTYSGEQAVFLSGNAPLVRVLQEALARDDHLRSGRRKEEARRKARSFIQMIHHFRDEALENDTPPYERVAIFDEAQRAWDQEKLSAFMKKKRGKLDLELSEPEFLIDIMNRHKGWATVICLVGGGARNSHRRICWD